MSDPSNARALIVVPPFLKYAAGPLLGPALLVGAARAAGHEAAVLDLNIRWIRERIPEGFVAPPSVVAGDHDKPGGLLSELQRRQFAPLVEEALTFERLGDESPGLTLTASHDAVDLAADRLSASSMGTWISATLCSQARPDVVALSVLFSGQVLAGLAISRIAKALWPGVVVVWGGPHVTALQDRIAEDHRFGRLVDAFVLGYAEKTFVDLLHALSARAPWPTGCIRAGERRVCRAEDDPRQAPVFEGLRWYGIPRLTLPAQLSRGCSYGRCEFCTYPAIEGAYRPLEHTVVEPVVKQAAQLGANVAFKDSLLVPKRLMSVAETIRGRVRWAACTKLHASLDARFLRALAAGGCDTLEVGLETIDEKSQRIIDKRQSLDLFLRMLDAAGESGIGLVINYITGFPHEDARESKAGLARVKEELARRPWLRSQLEHNTFQLERLSPMAADAPAHGIRVTREWPWASVLAWEATRGRARLPVRR